MDHGVALQLPAQVTFDVVDGVVEGQDIPVGRHLSMKRDHGAAGSVVVDHQVVYALHLLVGKDDLLDFFHKLLVRRLAQQGADGLSGGTDAGIKDKSRHQDAAPAVDHQIRKMTH